MKPYVDLVLGDAKIRTFDIDADQDDYEWHRDRTDREIEVLSGDGWLLQFDNRLPMPLEIGTKYFIPEGMFHRVHKGKTQLKIRIRDK